MNDPVVVDTILEHACRAPSVHNTQPWTWRVSDNRVDLFADFSRQLVYADPQRRDLVISCGAALHHFEAAAKAMGWTARVRRTPDPSEPRFIASIQLFPGAVPPDAQDILGSIANRRTDRRRLTSWPVPVERLSALASTGNKWGVQVLPVHDDGVKAQLDRLTTRADELQRRNPDYVRELNAWTTYWSNTGVPVAHVPRAADVGSSDALHRRFPNGVLDDPVVDAETVLGRHLADHDLVRRHCLADPRRRGVERHVVGRDPRQPVGCSAQPGAGGSRDAQGVAERRARRPVLRTAHPASWLVAQPATSPVTDAPQRCRRRACAHLIRWFP